MVDAPITSSSKDGQFRWKRELTSVKWVKAVEQAMFPLIAV